MSSIQRSARLSLEAGHYAAAQTQVSVAVLADLFRFPILRFDRTTDSSHSARQSLPLDDLDFGSSAVLLSHFWFNR